MVATDDDNTAVTLAEVPSRCSSACALLVECGGEESCVQEGDVVECVTPPDRDECESGCNEVITEAIQAGGERCESLASALLDCVDRSSCEEILSGDDLCDPEQQALETCSGSSGRDDNAKDSNGTSGFGVAGPAVSCQAGIGAVAENPGGETPPGVACDNQWLECSDGHDYRVSCVDHQGTGTVVCSCIVDGIVTGGFGGGEICTAVTEGGAAAISNAECGWSLAY
jgi:hypothetical protein